MSLPRIFFKIITENIKFSLTDYSLPKPLTAEIAVYYALRRTPAPLSPLLSSILTSDLPQAPTWPQNPSIQGLKRGVIMLSMEAPKEAGAEKAPILTRR